MMAQALQAVIGDKLSDDDWITRRRGFPMVMTQRFGP